MSLTGASLAAGIAAFGLLVAAHGLALADAPYLLGTRSHQLEKAADGSFGQALLSAPEDTTVTQSLPFAFPFYGATHSSLLVDANGVLLLDSGSVCDFCSGADVLQNNVAIAPLWSDWRGGTVSYLAFPDHVVFTWAGVQHYYDDPGTATFQASLYPGGQIEFNYGPDAASTAGVTIGISGGPAGAIVVSPDAQPASMFDSSASYAFLPPGALLPGDPPSGGTVDPSATPEADSLLLFATGAAGVLGYARVRMRARASNHRETIGL